MNIGSLLVSAATAPLANLVGWHLAMFSWMVLIVVGISVWSVHMRRYRETATDVTSSQTDVVAAMTGPIPQITSTRTLREAVLRPAPILLGVAFALQCGMYYGLSTWLPTMTADLLHTDLTAAGGFAAIFQGVGILGAILVPIINRWVSAPVAAALVGCWWLAIPLGMLFAPQLIVLWLALGGIAQAGGFVIVIATLVSVARTDAEAASMSAVVQGSGYVIAAVAAPVLGALHDATAGWTVPLIVVTVTSAAYLVALISAVIAARSERA